MRNGDRYDSNLRSYLRDRMAGDLPSNFAREVMDDVHRTNQAGRGAGWRIFAGLTTVALAALIVVVGLGLVERGDVGEAPTASSATTPSGSPSEAPTSEASESASASEAASPSPSVEPTTAEGEFGPIHAMTPDEAFGEAATCENADAMNSVGEPTDVTYSISYPAEWFTNEAGGERSPCTLFGAEPIEDVSGGVGPGSVAVTIDLPPGGDFSTEGSSVTTEEYTVDGVAAVRYEIAASEGGFMTGPSVVWIIAVEGNLPGVGNDRPYMAIGTTSEDPDQFAEWVDVVDRMVATLDLAGR